MEDNKKVAGIAPIAVELEEGKKYSWCTCGHSEKQPFCDGGHKGAESTPSLRFEAEKTGTAYLCNCKMTKNPPYCDGSHKTCEIG
ncbi:MULTISPECIES: CDGSH iron-sulfur domain-containing protein [unclassified Dokdonia]|jgi:CDGSH-type Zn-finger protein|uniref:CDGSH iron-sulfur domain-containing protein n=1 Tax=unclassified Dokdonia TaxID=2615033 RepID=UPI0030ECAB0C|tara:strand:+ start:150659 stop:150913 length:255 start_codon:yes stop_codon:yes gene_type:complete